MPKQAAHEVEDVQAWHDEAYAEYEKALEAYTKNQTAKTEAAYFKMINEQGGINGRKINFISYDDGYSPPKTVEQVRKLVESDEVLFVFNSLGTPPNTAIQKYMNSKKVPQLFVATGATKWNDPKGHPWTMGWQPSYQSEAKIYAAHLLKTKPNAKIAVLYQNDDYGKDVLKGLKDGLGGKTNMIIAEMPYETADPNVRSGLDTLAATMTVVLEATRAAMTSDLKPETITALAGNAVGWLKPMIARAGGIINGDEEVTDAASPQAVVDQLMKR